MITDQYSKMEMRVEIDLLKDRITELKSLLKTWLDVGWVPGIPDDLINETRKVLHDDTGI